MGRGDDSLYLGVNLTGVTSHDAFVQSWERPVPPPDFPNLVAVVRSLPGTRSLRWELDFFNAETGRYASAVREVSIPWPWRDGFLPLDGDWCEIGIPPQW